MFSYSSKDKPQRSWNALCLRKIEYIHHFTVRHTPSLSVPSQQQLLCCVMPKRPMCVVRTPPSVVALCVCNVWGKVLSKKLSSGSSPCTSVENRRGLLSLFMGRKSLCFCDLKFLLKKFLAFKIRERTRFSAFTCTCWCFTSIARMQKLADGHRAYIVCPVLAAGG